MKMGRWLSPSFSGDFICISQAFVKMRTDIRRIGQVCLMDALVFNTERMPVMLLVHLEDSRAIICFAILDVITTG